MNYIESLPPAEFRKLLREVCASQKEHYTIKTKTSVQISFYLTYLEGLVSREDIIDRMTGFFDKEDLLSLKVHGFIIDIYMRMVDDLTKESL